MVRYVERNSFDKDVVNNITSKGDISRPLAKLLAGRGVSTYQDAIKFLNPSKNDMLNPFDIYGMREGSERIKKGIDNNENIIIYGDYDCDGLTSISIIYNFLKDKVTNLNYYVPNRYQEGYGLHSIIIEALNLQFNPDLIITVDCGITSKDEVDFIKSKGIDIVVTDHHEPVENMVPNCICIDAKLNKQGFYDYCGAGVALKLVEAISGRDEALKYVDLAALGTIADIVPLVSENRIIAKLGLDKLNQKQSLYSKEIAKLLNYERVHASDVMFKIAPRINALGRLDDATPVIKLFTSDDFNIVNNIAKMLEENNDERRKSCKNVVDDILAKLRYYDLTTNRAIIMADKSWNVGILGIASAKLAEMFTRPVILFTYDDEGFLRGSARSNSKINLFECLSYCSKYFVEFGGHSAAAGIKMEPKYFDEFLKYFNEIIKEKYSLDCFYPTYSYDLLYDDEITPEVIDELQKLEPCGFANPTPIFLLKNVNLNFRQINNKNHIKTYYNNIELVGFNGIDYIQSMNSKSNFLFSLQNKVFRGKNYTQGIIRFYNLVEPNIIDDENVCLQYLIYNRYLHNYSNDVKINKCNIKDLPINDDILGNLYITFSVESYLKFIKYYKSINDNVLCDIYSGSIVNPYNRIVLSPSKDYPYDYYKNIYFIDQPITPKFVDFLNEKTNAKVYYVGNDRVNVENIRRLRCKSIDEYREIFKILKKTNFYGAKNMFEFGFKLYSLGDSINKFKTLSTLYIMIELGIVKYDYDNIDNKKSCFSFVDNVKTNLEKSLIYNFINEF